MLTAIVTHYATHYSAYELHGVNVGKARVTPQNLDESIWAIGILRSVRWAGPLLSPAVHDAARSLAAEVTAVLEPQLGMIHNIHCWIVAALAECAVTTDNERLLSTAVDGPFGARNQLLEGMHPEGLWFEINPHYHFYTVNALLSFVETVGTQALSGEPLSRLRRAVSAPAQLAYSDGRIPAYGDGWPDTFLGTFAQTAEVASALLPGAGPEIVADYVDDRPAPVQLWAGANHVGGPAPRRSGRYSVGALLYGADTIPDRGAAGASSFVWPGPGIGVLRGAGVRLGLRFGPDAGWHDHHDKLAVDVELGTWRSLDLGTSGYGAAITRWMRSQVAHNVVVVGDADQPKHAGELVEFDDGSLVARSTWNGAEVRRTLGLTQDGWTDEMDIVCEPGTTLEWVFHGDGVVLAAGGDALEFTDDDLGHGWLADVRTIPAVRGRVSVRWDHEDAPGLDLELPPGWSAYRARADANPTGLLLGVVGAKGPAEARTILRARFTRRRSRS
ncbi:heparinase II/III family protein [Pseudactinotalea suaedae]|uniref:heparinase II/III family protein n=1 Tax=Pseudactinotalea suaedae TaxID=1524924 RepID=UPI0019D520A2|nr:heparinase II/III family protein [Pseudactinotalea suaedae]